jgi:transcriptional regulator with XRE-family HTH domain
MASRLFVGAASFSDPQQKLLHICHNRATLAPMAKNTAHQAAVNALLSETERAEYARRVQALRSRNTLLTMLETTRETQGMTKRALASRAGLEASSVRRLLTSATANPTTDNAFRLMAAMGIALEAKLPTGERVQLVSPGSPVTTAESAAAA